MIPNDKCGYEELFYDPTKNVDESLQDDVKRLVTLRICWLGRGVRGSSMILDNQ